jgi:DNA-binding response OmpR family regulator
MVMASREDRPFLTANPRSAQVALAPDRLRDRSQWSPTESAPTAVLDRGLRPRVAALDDDPAAVASVAAILNQSGFEVFAFTDALQLETASGAAPFAAYVLDWYLGNTTAAALIEGLRQRPSSAHVPIFLLSGNLAIGGVPTDQALAQAIERHRVEFRAKPYSGVKLAADLRLALGDRRA